MKTIRLTCCVWTLILFALVSCKKDNPKIEGFWAVEYFITGDDITYAYTFNIKSDLPTGQDFYVLDVDGYPMGSGNWSINQNLFQVEFTYNNDPVNVLVYSAEYNSSTGTMSKGTWKYKADVNNAGTWTAAKK
jgi:hypothetical protein